MRVAVHEKLRLWGIRSLTGDSDQPEWSKGPEVTAESDGGALEIFLFATMFKVAIGTVIGTVLLRAACALYNNLAGGEGSLSSVPQPLLSTAIGITFVTTLVNAVAGFVIGLLVGAGGAAAGASERGPAVIAQLLSLPVGLLVLAGMNSALLPTTFARGFLVALCYLLVAVVMVVALAVLIGGLVLVVSLLR